LLLYDHKFALESVGRTSEDLCDVTCS